jgi:hypothetical protein
VSWVLILNSSYTQEPPAVIGGFSSLEEAEAVGDAATAFGEPAPDASMGWHSVPYPHYLRYTVIPGAGVQGPSRSVHCHLERDWSPDGVDTSMTEPGRIYRHKKHFGPPAANGGIAMEQIYLGDVVVIEQGRVRRAQAGEKGIVFPAGIDDITVNIQEGVSPDARTVLRFAKPDTGSQQEGP